MWAAGPRFRPVSWSVRNHLSVSKTRALIQFAAVILNGFDGRGCLPTISMCWSLCMALFTSCHRTAQQFPFVSIDIFISISKKIKPLILPCTWKHLAGFTVSVQEEGPHAFKFFSLVFCSLCFFTLAWKVQGFRLVRELTCHQIKWMVIFLIAGDGELPPHKKCRYKYLQ